ncbi:SDR family oxidoreductase [Prauserella alba]|uniref:SDR family oxidoreductase n=1 Tax=Prauserella alba TaxID=176898 RepID=A0ABP4FQS1_9PSEU|nr:SDR family oxidoreductase [Prauserella alba]MCP2180428.1 NAD(P)-dependent dehydrogenase, short-chain alcohol dehydrogenase family [Prauserella alba]
MTSTAGPGDLTGTVALVTGASRGIGLGIAQDLVRRGAKVCITARKPDPLAEAVTQLGGDDVALGVAGRADDAEHRQEAVDRTMEKFGRIDYLANNTGINPHFGSLLDCDEQAAAKIFQVNVLAPLAWTRAVRDAWMGEHGGAIVNVASVAGIRTSPGIGMYGVSKAAVIRATSELAEELGPQIRVNCVAPAIVKTQFATQLYEGREAEIASSYPLKRLGVPSDIAGAVTFLLSEQAAWLTGQTLVLDGGVTLGGGL